MKKRVGIWFLPSVLLIWLIAILINFNNFLMGSPADAFNITATGVYIMLVTAGCFFPMGKKTRLFALVWSGATFITAIIAGVIALYELSFGLVIIPFSVVFLTPFYGVAIVRGNSWALFYLIITVISMVWVTGNLYAYIKKQRDE